MKTIAAIGDATTTKFPGVHGDARNVEAESHENASRAALKAMHGHTRLRNTLENTAGIRDRREYGIRDAYSCSRQEATQLYVRGRITVCLYDLF